MKISRECNEFGLELRWKWSQWYMYIVIPITLLWTAGAFWQAGFIDFLFAISIDGFADSLNKNLTISDGLFLLVGIGFSYWALSLYFNETIIRVGSSIVSVHHAPLPWPGTKTVNTSTIKQIHVNPRSVRGNRGHTFLVYDVDMMDYHGVHQNLVSRLRSDQQARYIKREIEKEIEKHEKLEKRRIKDGKD